MDSPATSPLLTAESDLPRLMDPGTVDGCGSNESGCGDRTDVPRRLVAALAVTQTVGYGVLYYAFSALLGPMSRDLGISTATAAGALTTSVLTTGLMSVPVGRWLDARGGHALMTTGSVLGAAAVVAWSQVHTVAQLYAVFAVIGVASAMVLYEPAFAVVVAVTAPQTRTRALLGITLVAGFASSIFIPLTGQLLEAMTWRHTLLILATGYAVVTIPLHAMALRHTGPRHRPDQRDHDRHEPQPPEHRADPQDYGRHVHQHPDHHADQQDRGRHVDRRREHSAGAASKGPGVVVLRDAGFWLLVIGFVLHAAALAVVAVHLVLYLTTLGHPPAVAATLAGLLGLLSVTGRIVASLSLRWLPMATITAIVLTVQGAAISLLPFTGRHLAGAISCLVLFGLGFGVASIAGPAILLDRYGSNGYATTAGTLAAPVIIAKACAPLGGAVLAGAAGYRPVILAVAAACVIAGLFVGASRRVPQPPRQPLTANDR